MRTQRTLAVLSFASLACGAGAGTALASSPPSRPQASVSPTTGAPPARATPRSAVLSNETTTTRWAYVSQTSPISTQPQKGSRRIAWLHRYTEDGFPEVYLLLVARWDARGREWVKLRIPMRPIGQMGWVPRAALGAFHVTHQQLVIDRSRVRISLYESGRLRWRAPVGIGKPTTPTPPGHFWIREIWKLSDPSSGYWPYAFGTADYSVLTDWPGGGVVGIHGPYHQPQLIPGRPSHGCVRLRVSDDAWLGRHVSVGTPVLIV